MITLRSDNILVCTWNIGCETIEDDIHDWFSLARHSGNIPGIVSVSLQEVTCSPTSFIINDRTCSKHIANIILINLNDYAAEDPYVTSVIAQQAGLLLLVLIRQSAAFHICEISTATATCGLGNVVPNKGAVAVHLRWGRTRIALVNAHLSAHTGNTRRRNMDYKHLSESLIFTRTPIVYDGDVHYKNFSLDDHDLIVWAGDLNYRLDLKKKSNVWKLVSREPFHPSLFRHDMLRLQIAAGNTFTGFLESTVKFLPTYKYDKGTDIFDTSKKQREPAWCDRILWKASTDTQVKSQGYIAHPLFRTSDHKPVSALLSLNVAPLTEREYSTIVRLAPLLSGSANAVPFFTDFGYRLVTNTTALIILSVAMYSWFRNFDISSPL